MTLASMPARRPGGFNGSFDDDPDLPSATTGSCLTDVDASMTISSIASTCKTDRHDVDNTPVIQPRAVIAAWLGEGASSHRRRAPSCCRESRARYRFNQLPS
jgi:hypothetical protein